MLLLNTIRCCILLASIPYKYYDLTMFFFVVIIQMFTKREVYGNGKMKEILARKRKRVEGGVMSFQKRGRQGGAGIPSHCMTRQKLGRMGTHDSSKDEIHPWTPLDMVIFCLPPHLHILYFLDPPLHPIIAFHLSLLSTTIFQIITLFSISIILSKLFITLTNSISQTLQILFSIST